MKKAMLPALILCLSLLLPRPGAQGAYVPQGADFTGTPGLAQGLDRVFSGEIDLFTDPACTSRAPARLGSRDVPPGKTLYIRDAGGKVYSGSTCYIYANAVYATLFGDVPFHGEGGWRNSRRVLGPCPAVSYSQFAAAGICCGALLRTTKNADGSYNSNYGHSIIILGYDASTLTYLEGNGDGRGLIRVVSRSWDAFNAASLTNRGYKVSFAVQPTREYLDGLSGADAPAVTDPVGHFTRSRAYTGCFRDVPYSAWYAKNVAAVYELGLMTGTGDTAFSPAGQLTVREAVTMAARFLSLYYADGYNFTGQGPWYAPYYAYLGLWGINTDFASPHELITRGQFAALMARVLPKEAVSFTRQVSFPDVSGAEAAGVEKLAASGILNGSGGKFRPRDPLTRAEAAAILSRMADRGLRV